MRFVVVVCCLLLLLVISVIFFSSLAFDFVNSVTPIVQCAVLLVVNIFVNIHLTELYLVFYSLIVLYIVISVQIHYFMTTIYVPPFNLRAI